MKLDTFFVIPRSPTEYITLLAVHFRYTFTHLRLVGIEFFEEVIENLIRTPSLGCGEGHLASV